MHRELVAASSLDRFEDPGPCFVLHVGLAPEGFGVKTFETGGLIVVHVSFSLGTRRSSGGGKYLPQETRPENGAPAIRLDEDLGASGSDAENP